MKPFDFLLALVVVLIWGVNFPVIEHGLGSLPPLLFTALRFLACLFPFLLFIPRRGIPWSLLLKVGLLIGVVVFGLLFLGMHMGLSAGMSSLVMQSQVLFTLVLAVFTVGERPRSQQVFGTALAFSGMAVIGMNMDSNATMAGFILVLLSGLAWSVVNIILKRAGPVNQVSLMVWSSLFPPLPLLLISLIFEQDHWITLQALDWRGVGAIFYTGILSSVVGWSIWGGLLNRYEAGRVAPLSLLVPLVGMSSSALLLGESFRPYQLLAAGLVLTGLALVLNIRMGKNRPLVMQNQG
ncbi:MAG: EamA family transporter [Deltaproteobacteria bacterium]|nr:EamA family transporter [Deltaproteobacteria bacterium]